MVEMRAQPAVLGAGGPCQAVCRECWESRDCDAKERHCGSSLFAAITLKGCWKQFFFQ